MKKLLYLSLFLWLTTCLVRSVYSVYSITPGVVASKVFEIVKEDCSSAYQYIVSRIKDSGESDDVSFNNKGPQLSEEEQRLLDSLEYLDRAEHRLSKAEYNLRKEIFSPSQLAMIKRDLEATLLASNRFQQLEFIRDDADYHRLVQSQTALTQINQLDGEDLTRWFPIIESCKEGIRVRRLRIHQALQGLCSPVSQLNCSNFPNHQISNPSMKEDSIS
jgi:hypothetical protein